MSYDNVERPKHYNSHPSGIQPIEIAEHMTLNMGTAFIYGWRYNQKGTPAEDLKKMLWFLRRQQTFRGPSLVSGHVFQRIFREDVMEPRKHIFNRPSPWCEPVRHALAGMCDWHTSTSEGERDILLKRVIRCVETAIEDECCFDGRSLQP